MAKQLRISEIITMIESGSKRSQIQEHFGLTMTEMKNVFSHPKLKGLRAKRSAVNLLDDTEEESFMGIPVSVNQQILFTEEVN